MERAFLFMSAAFMAATKIGLNKNLRFIKFIMYAIQWSQPSPSRGEIKAGMTKKQQGNEQLYMQDNGQDIVVARVPCSFHLCVLVFMCGTLSKQFEIYYGLVRGCECEIASDNPCCVLTLELCTTIWLYSKSLTKFLSNQTESFLLSRLGLIRAFHLPR